MWITVGSFFILRDGLQLCFKRLGENLHYVFDRWKEKNVPQLPRACYADDRLVHYHPKEDADQILECLQ